MQPKSIDILILGFSITSSWGQRDMPRPPWGSTRLYDDFDALRRRWLPTIAAADVVIVGSSVPEGDRVLDLVLDHARGLRVFYDIDTPVTLAALERGEHSGAQYPAELSWAPNVTRAGTRRLARGFVAGPPAREILP